MLAQFIYKQVAMTKSCQFDFYMGIYIHIRESLSAAKHKRGLFNSMIILMLKFYSVFGTE